MLQLRKGLILFAALVALATVAVADQTVTVLLRSGERVTGRFDGINQGLFYVDVSATDERKIPLGQIAVIDLVGGAQGLPETELREARGNQHLLLTRSGAATKGQFVGAEGEARNPTVIFRAEGGEERRLPFSEIGRLYLGNYPGGQAGGTPPTTHPAPAPGGPLEAGQILVRGNQRWTDTGIRVQRGQNVAFSAVGEVTLSADDSDTAGPAGSNKQRRAAGAPLPNELAGALIGRIGQSAVFAIGNQEQGLSMPASGTLFLGINDDVVSDNRGEFRVRVSTAGTRQPS
jgi:hypothetical protein